MPPSAHVKDYGKTETQLAPNGSQEEAVPLVPLSHHKDRRTSLSTSNSGSEDLDADLEAIAREIDGAHLPSTRLKTRHHDAHESDSDRDGSDGEEDVLSQVRSVVKETDDPSLPTVTARVLLLGSILCGVGAAISQLFFFKSNAPSFSGFLIILLSYPSGHYLSKVLPTRYFFLKLPYFGPISFTLNPGPFSYKEHLLIAVLAGSGSGAAYGADIIAIQDLYYHQDIGPLGGVLLILSTQMLGFGLSGLLYKLLVIPSKMIWPINLVSVSLFNTLHGEEDTLTWKRVRLFRTAFLCVFAWQFVPSVVAPILTSLALVCIIGGGSATSSVLGSAYRGYGMLNLSFDWSVIGSTGGFYTPWFASLNSFSGAFGMVWIISPLLYFNNFWDALSFDSPIGPGLYNKLYQKFDINSILDPVTLSLDEAKWAEQGPIVLTPHFALTYGVSFAVLTSAIMTVLLWHWQDIKDAFRGSTDPPDIHVQILHSNYEQVPASWYLAMLVTMTGAAIFVVTFYPMQLPIWGLLLSLLVALLFLPACGIIAATTGTVIGLNVITEFIAGYLLPGQPIANVTFKCFGYMTMAQALALVSDLKLGLYMKIPPKSMFICQSWGTALGAIVNYIYVRSVISSKREFLDGTTVDPTGQWTGRSPQIFFSASVIWGLIGPERFFSGKYRWLYLGFIIGGLLPLIPWLLHKRAKRAQGVPYTNGSSSTAAKRRRRSSKSSRKAGASASFWKKVSIPLILDGMSSAPQVPTNTLIMGFLSAYASQRWLLRKHPKWFEKYNFVLSAALDAGTSIQALTVYVFALGYIMPEWWGNSANDTERCSPSS